MKEREEREEGEERKEMKEIGEEREGKGRGKRGKRKGNIEIIENTAIFSIIFICGKKRTALFVSKLKMFV